MGGIFEAMHRNATHPLHARHLRWAMLALITLVQLVASLASQGVGIWGAFVHRQYDLGAGRLGMLVGVSNSATILGMFFLAPWLDRHGERAWQVAGMLLLGISWAILGTAADYGGLVMGMAMAGLGYSPIQPAGSKGVYHWFEPRQRGLAMGIRQAALPLGGVLAASVFPWLLTRQSWPMAMAIVGSVVALVGVGFGLGYRPCVQASPVVEPRRSPWAGLHGCLKSDTFRQVALLGTVLVAAQSVLSVFWVAFIVDRGGSSLSTAATCFLILQLAGVVGRVVLSLLSDRVALGHQGVVVLCGFATALVLVAAPLLPTPSSATLMGVSWIAGFVGFGWYGPWVARMAEITIPQEVGQGLAGAMMLNQAAIALAPVVVGFLVDRKGGYVPAFLSLATLMVGVLLAHGYKRGR